MQRLNCSRTPRGLQHEPILALHRASYPGAAGLSCSLLFMVLARPTFRSLLWSLVLVIPGVFLRGYASGYVKKNAELTITGPYAFTRNPLYLGSFMIAFGFAMASRSPTIALGPGGGFCLYLHTGYSGGGRIPAGHIC